jgi:hypothetical protein
VGVDVDESGRDHLTFRVDLFAPTPLDDTHRRDQAIRDRQVAGNRFAAGPVDQLSVPDHDVMGHLGFLPGNQSPVDHTGCRMSLSLE